MEAADGLHIIGVDDCAEMLTQKLFRPVSQTNNGVVDECEISINIDLIDDIRKVMENGQGIFRDANDAVIPAIWKFAAVAFVLHLF